MNNIYLFTIPKNYMCWDCYSDHVVIALNEVSARKRILSSGRDYVANEGEEAREISILSMGIAPLWKGTAEGIKDGVDDIFDK